MRKLNIFKGKSKTKARPPTEEELLETLAEIKTRQRDANVERLIKEKELKALQQQASEIQDENGLMKLTQNCARTEMLLEYWDKVIQTISDAAFIFEKIRTLQKTTKIQHDINEFLSTIQMKDPQLALNLEEFQENLKELSRTAITQLDQLKEVQITEPNIEEKMKEWEQKLKKQ